jgi:hypothetical protein
VFSFSILAVAICHWLNEGLQCGLRLQHPDVRRTAAMRR